MVVKSGKHDQVIDITDKIHVYLDGQEKEKGLCNIFVAHTTCSVTSADLDPGTDLDTLDFLSGIIPDIKFRHPHNPEHAPAHIISSIIGSSVSIPFENKKLSLGTWQRVVLIELDGPRDREIKITVT